MWCSRFEWDAAIKLWKLEIKKETAPSEDRTHDLEIMRLARCQLRYRGTSSKELIKKYYLMLTT